MPCIVVMNYGGALVCSDDAEAVVQRVNEALGSEPTVAIELPGVAHTVWPLHIASVAPDPN